MNDELPSMIGHSQPNNATVEGEGKAISNYPPSPKDTNLYDLATLVPSIFAKATPLLDDNDHDGLRYLLFMITKVGHLLKQLSTSNENIGSKLLSCMLSKLSPTKQETFRAQYELTISALATVLKSDLVSLLTDDQMLAFQPMKCCFCMRGGHFIWTCPQLKAEPCVNCFELGHFAKDCRKTVQDKWSRIEQYLMTPPKEATTEELNGLKEVKVDVNNTSPVDGAQTH